MSAPRHAITIAVLTAVLWGLWWIPIRWTEALGLPGPWVGAVMVSGAFALSFALWLARPSGRGALSVRGSIGAMGVGAAVMTYSAALVEGEIVRVLLIFYLAPVWAKLLERVFMGVRWTFGSSLALVLSFAGIMVLVGGTPGAGIRPGDGLALVSGMAWAAGSTLVFASGDDDTLGLTWLACAAGAGMAALLAALTAGLPDGMPGALPLAAGLGAGALYTAPLLLLTAWSARHVAPGLLSFLLTAEIASGVLSSALFTAEPFGWPHALGTVLIALGAAAEVIARRRRKA